MWKKTVFSSAYPSNFISDGSLAGDEEKDRECGIQGHIGCRRAFGLRPSKGIHNLTFSTSKQPKPDLVYGLIDVYGRIWP
jgi:hypothetical protein